MLLHKELRSGFSDYFAGSASYSVDQQVYTRPFNENNEILNSVFHNIHCGPAIYFTTSLTIRLYVENCMFFNCSAQSNGGAININCPNGYFVMDKICGFNCFTESSHGQFVYTYHALAILNYVSIHRCPGQYQTGTLYSPIYGYAGNQNMTYCNSSYCYTYQHSICYMTSSNKIVQYFCSFTNNYATHSFGSYFTSNTNTFVLKSIFINNNSPLYALIYSDYQIQFEESIFMFNYCILFNKATTLTFSVINCFINRITAYALYTGSPVSAATTNGYTQTYNIAHFVSYYCNEQQSAQELTPCATLPAPPTSCGCQSDANIHILNTISSVLNIIIYPLLIQQ